MISQILLKWLSFLYIFTPFPSKGTLLAHVTRMLLEKMGGVLIYY